ncbi:MAG: hypothetical protein AAF363_09705 [Bacteroidota bacterium]
MIHIYTSNNISEINQAVKEVEGLSQHVQVKDLSEIDRSEAFIIVNNDEIISPFIWNNSEPPTVFRPVPFDPQSLIGLILSRIGYAKEALNFVGNEGLKKDISSRLHLINGGELTGGEFDLNEYYDCHNRAVLAHYLNLEVQVGELYSKAMELSPNVEAKAFTTKQYVTYLIDHKLFQEAENHLNNCLSEELTDEARFSLKIELINIHFEKSGLTEGSEKVKLLIGECLKYYEKTGDQITIASLLLQATDIANIEQSFSEALGYVNRAVEIYSEEHIPEFQASALMKKGTLLYTWAQNGNPQFYQTAIDTYQKALKTFTRDEAPHIYFEIQHNLAVIYAEIPADEKKKGMWAAFSATSFKECLSFYTKEQYPYEFAMVANNYANALQKYPPAKTGDNLEKAISFYSEALEIRTAEEYPQERAYTILNFLEACWRVHNINETMERVRYNDMLKKAGEISKLTSEESLLEQAGKHLEHLQELGVSLLKG